MYVHLPTEILTKVDLTSLELYPDSFVEQELQEKIADLVYKVKIQGEYGYITLLMEHQFLYDPLMAFRLLKYRVLLMEQHLKQQLVQKHIRDKKFLLNLTEIIINTLNFNSHNQYLIIDYIENTLYYIMKIANIDDIDLFNRTLENISIIKEHKIMTTVAQQLEQRGI
ncbi:MAG: Rpn family recombination-promoting nuclease/putative transposase [Gammaproteobacteria bacterium]